MNLHLGGFFLSKVDWCCKSNVNSITNTCLVSDTGLDVLDIFLRLLLLVHDSKHFIELLLWYNFDLFCFLIHLIIWKYWVRCLKNIWNAALKTALHVLDILAFVSDDGNVCWVWFFGILWSKHLRNPWIPYLYKLLWFCIWEQACVVWWTDLAKYFP